MLTIKRTDLANKIIANAKGTKIVGLVYTTEPKLKKACPFTNVRKRTENVLMLGVNYANRLEKNGEAPAGANPFYTEVEGHNWLVQHPNTGKLYLRVSPTGNNFPKVEYTCNEGVITKKDLEPFFYAQSGTAPEVFTISFDNINFMTIAGEQYQVID